MKIKNIINVCKSTGMLVILEGERCQWIGDGAAFYPLHGLPEFDEETICGTFDISDAQAEKMLFKHYSELPKEISFQDFGHNKEIPVGEPLFTFIYGGKKVCAYETPAGVAFIDTKHFTPFADIDNRDLDLYARYSTEDKLYFVAKMGMMLVGVITPIEIIDEELVQRLEKFLYLFRIELLNRQPPEEPEGDEQLSAFDDEDDDEDSDE